MWPEGGQWAAERRPWFPAPLAPARGEQRAEEREKEKGGPGDPATWGKDKAGVGLLEKTIKAWLDILLNRTGRG